MPTRSRKTLRLPANRLTVMLALALAGAGGALAPPLGAVVIVVTTTADDVATNGNCTLREAISAAANDLVYDACPAGSDDVDLVEVPAGDYVWGGTLNVPFDRMRIHGPDGALPAVHVNLGSNGRFLRIYNDSEVTIENVELLNGTAMLDGSNPHGGQIAVDGADLVLKNLRSVGGIAKGGGAIFFRGGDGDSLRIERSRFDSSNALSPDPGFVTGGALEVRLQGDSLARILDSEFLHAAATGTTEFAWPQGGAIFLTTSSDDVVEIARSRFHDNRVIAFANGLASGGAATSPSPPTTSPSRRPASAPRRSTSTPSSPPE
jgi:CSLREA domain-containing protein